MVRPTFHIFLMGHFASSAGSECRLRPRAVTAHQRRTNTTRCRVPQRTRQVSMPPGWRHLLAVVMMVVASLCASASLEESQGQFQPKEVLRVLDEAQGSLMADLEEYRNSTRRGSVEERAMESSSTLEAMPTRAQASGRYGSGGPSAREKPAKPKYPELMDGQKSVRLNIRVDLVLVGFQGDGGKLLDIPQKTLELWLEHLTSVVPHATVADHAPASAGQTGGGEAMGGGDSQSSPHAAPEVEYAYRYHVVDVDKRVRDAVEAHMRAYLRDEEDEEEEEVEEEEDKRESDGGRRGERSTGGTGSKQTSGRQMYMPSWHMEELLGSLAVKLQASGQRETRYLPDAAKKTSAAFTLFILNPRPAWVLPQEHKKSAEGRKVTYGYRCGHSSGALAALTEDREVVQRAEKVERLEQKRWRIVHGAGSQDNGEFLEDWTPALSAERYTFYQSYINHIEWTDGKKASSEWALDRLDQPLSRVESDEKAFLLSGDPDVLPEGNVRALLRDVLEEHRRMVDAPGGNGIGTGNRGGTRAGGAGACLTDTWVSGERFAWVDLQAGPFAWGPAAGGDGYKSAFSGLAPAPKPLVNPPGKPSGSKESRREERRQALIAARGKLSARIDGLLAMREQMACDEKGEQEKRPKKGRGASRQQGAVAVACDEVLAQLTFVQQFQAGERKALSTADAAEAAEEVAVAENGRSTNETFVRNLESLRSQHVMMLETALEVLAPATESDHENHAPFVGSATALSVDSQVLLARLAALVSSLSRGIVTPASTLPLSLPPPDVRSDATRTTRGCGSEGTTAGWPGARSSSGGDGASSDCSVPYRLPSGPALTQPRGSGVGGTAAAAHPSRPSALDVFIPESLEFTLYVVSIQDVYPPLGAPRRFPEGRGSGDAEVRANEGVGTGARGDRERVDAGPGLGGVGGRYRGSSGFDLPAFQAGAMSLKLPNQKASFTVHQVDSSSDTVLVAALAGATRESSVNRVTAEGDTFTDKRVSIDSASLHHQLKARADEDSEGSGGTGAEEEARRHTRHITILLYSFAGPQSVYVDEMWRARGVGGDTVVVAQSEPRRDSAPPLTCGGRPVEDDPRNPLRQALAALGSIVGGLVPSQDSWDETRGGHVVHDWRWSMSESPMSPLVPRARFSEIDQDIIYRTHVVRALSASVQLTRVASSLLLDALRWEDSRNTLEGPLLERLTTARGRLQDVSNLRDTIRKNVGTVAAYDHVARQLNPLLDASREAYTLASELARDARDPAASGPERQESGTGAAPSGGDQQDAGLLRPLIALVVAVLAAWLLRGTVSSFAGARGRKRVKVN